MQIFYLMTLSFKINNTSNILSKIFIFSTKIRLTLWVFCVKIILGGIALRLNGASAEEAEAA